MATLVAIIAGLLLTLILLLGVPLQLRFRLTWHQALHGKVQLRWGWGLVKLTLPGPSSSAPSVEEEAPQALPQLKPRSAPSGLSFYRLLSQRPVRHRLRRFVRSLWRAVDKQGLHLQLRVGLADPAVTGQLWALIGPLSGYLYTLDDVDIVLLPDFLEADLELQAGGTVRLIPLQLLLIGLALLLSPTLWRGLLRARSDRAPRRVALRPSP